MATKKIKNRYLEMLGMTFIVLALVRCAFPGIAGVGNGSAKKPNVAVQESKVESVHPSAEKVSSHKYLMEGQKAHRIYSVPGYLETFPDTNDLQLSVARRWGVTPVKNRENAEERMSELVYVGSNPYYSIAPLHVSIPYLVPRAAILLQDIGQAFFDSLQVKGIPLHRVVVTSVLRSEADVRRLRSFNKNATENSCHLYGTTFDINYNRYETVEDPEGPPRRPVPSDSLKWVLSEVLRDMRQQQRCYIKYEVKQCCFHITVR